MKKIILILLLAVWNAPVFGQITIEECYELARENYPLVRRYGLIGQSEGYDLSNASKAWLPQLSLSGKATWQTDVTNIPVDIPGVEMPVLHKDQYQLLGELSQTIWDGGAVKASRESIRAQADVDRAQFEVDMYAVRERIDNLFFGILLLDEQLRLNGLYQEDLRINYERTENYMENGIANQADLDAVGVERLNARQNRVQMLASRQAYLNMLSAFIGRTLREETTLVTPEVTPVYPAAPEGRPEMTLFNAMEQQMDARRAALHAATRPQFGLFIQGGYGRPGLNMFEQDKFSLFAIGGVQLSWRFGNYYSLRNNLRKVDTGIQDIAVQRETFLFNNELQQVQYEAQFRQYHQLLADDDEIIRMRENIIRSSEAKYQNGTVSATDLMREVIAGQNAKVNKVVHEIERLQALYAMKNLLNN